MQDSLERYKRVLNFADLTDETYLPLPLAVLAAQARGVAAGITVKSLRREAARGRLTIYVVFGRQHTTLGDIRRMFEAGRVVPKVPAASPATSPARPSPKKGEGVELAALMLVVEDLREAGRASRRARKAGS